MNKEAITRIERPMPRPKPKAKGEEECVELIEGLLDVGRGGSGRDGGDIGTRGGEGGLGIINELQVQLF